MAHPKHIGVFQMCLRVPFLRVDKMGELGAIPNEKDRCIIEHPIPVAFIGPDLCGESTRITCSVCTAEFTAYGGETYCDIGSRSGG